MSDLTHRLNIHARSEHTRTLLLEAAAELERLQTLEAALPKTADGVTVTPGMEIHYRERHPDDWVPEWTTDRAYFEPPDFMSTGTDWHEWWSTREAAEKAREGGTQ